MKIKIGADPEFFLIKDGEYVPAVGLVPGTKEAPHKLRNGAVQLDGTAVEFNIDPASTSKEFSDNILDVLEQIRAMIPKEYKFAFQPSVIYSHKIWNTIPDSAKELGCNPDYSAYDGKAKTPPELPKELQTMRTGAGHIHIGFADVKDPTDFSHLWDCAAITKALDNCFGPFTRFYDNDVQRQKLYGQLGSFRPKMYGVEYRVLSNAWLNYPDMWPWLFGNIQRVINGLEMGMNLEFTLSDQSLRDKNYWLDCYLPGWQHFTEKMTQRKLAI